MGRGAMRRRQFIAGVGASAVLGARAARGQQTTAVVGFLSTGSAPFDVLRIDAFRRGLNELGYVEGRNVTSQYRGAANQMDRLPALAAELLRHPVTVIASL